MHKHPQAPGLSWLTHPRRNHRGRILVLVCSQEVLGNRCSGWRFCRNDDSGISWYWCLLIIKSLLNPASTTLSHYMKVVEMSCWCGSSALSLCCAAVQHFIIIVTYSAVGGIQQIPAQNDKNWTHACKRWQMSLAPSSCQECWSPHGKAPVVSRIPCATQSRLSETRRCIQSRSLHLWRLLDYKHNSADDPYLVSVWRYRVAIVFMTTYADMRMSMHDTGLTL